MTNISVIFVGLRCCTSDQMGCVGFRNGTILGARTAMGGYVSETADIDRLHVYGVFHSVKPIAIPKQPCYTRTRCSIQSLHPHIEAFARR